MKAVPYVVGASMKIDPETAVRPLLPVECACPTLWQRRSCKTRPSPSSMWVRLFYLACIRILQVRMHARRRSALRHGCFPGPARVRARADEHLPNTHAHRSCATNLAWTPGPSCPAAASRCNTRSLASAAAAAAAAPARPARRPWRRRRPSTAWRRSTDPHWTRGTPRRYVRHVTHDMYCTDDTSEIWGSWLVHCFCWAGRATQRSVPTAICTCCWAGWGRGEWRLSMPLCT